MKAKKMRSIAIIAMILLLVCMVFVACGRKGDTFSVTYMDGETLISSENVAKNAEPTLPDAPAKEGYSFVNWCTDAALTTDYSIGPVEEDLVLYAKYVKSQMYVSINSNGGTQVAAVMVSKGDAYTLPVPTKDGYTFTGYTYDNGVEEVEFATTGTYSLDKGIRVRANWEINTYDVLFYNGTTVLDTQKITHGKKIVSIEASLAGYDFGGWYTDKDLTQAFDIETAVTDNLNLYAKLTAKTFAIKVNADGGEDIEDIVVNYNGSYTLPTPVKTGYNFVKYTLDGEDFAQEGTYTKIGDVRVKAVWEIMTFNVTFKNASEETIDTVAVNYGANCSYRLSDVTVAAGYEAEGFYGNKNFDGEKVVLSSVAITENKTYFVKVIPSTFHITVAGYQNNGYDVVFGGNYDLGEPQVEGRIFDGFTFNEQAFDATGTYTWTTGITVVANFHDDPMYGKAWVYYHDGDNIVKEYLVTIADNVTADLSFNTDKTGYTFIGFFANSGLTDPYVAATITSTTNIYLKYEINTYDITIDENGGNALEDLTCDYNDSYTLPIPTRRGYEFTGYKINGILKTVAQLDEVNYTFVCTADVVVEAQWNVIRKTVTFTVGGDVVESITVDQFDTVTAIASPEKTGYSFDGWYVGSVAFDFNSEIENDTDLVAKFTAKTYTIYVLRFETSTYREVSVTYELSYAISDPVFDNQAVMAGYTHEGYRYIATGVSFPKSGTYSIDGDIYVEEVFSAALSESNNDDTDFVDKGTYFKQKQGSYYSYIFVTGGTYTMPYELERFTDNKYDTYITIDPDDAKKFTVGNMVGNFEIKLAGRDKKLEVEIVKQIVSLNAGNDYTGYTTLDLESSNFMNSTKETMKAGVNNIVFDISPISIRSEVIPFGQANLLIKVNEITVENNEEVKTLVDPSNYIYNTDQGSISFDVSMIGKTVEITLEAKYDTRITKTKVTYRFELNNGVNVYTNKELFDAYGDFNVHEINILRNIVAEFQNDSITYDSTTGNVRSEYDNGVYRRNTYNKATNTWLDLSTPDSIHINGNYFTIDGTKLPKCISKWNDTDIGYAVSNVQTGIFLYYRHDKNGVYYSDGDLTIDNLKIESNLNWNNRNETRLTRLNGVDKQYLYESGSITGIVLRGGTLNLNNDIITRCCIALHIDSDVAFNSGTVAAILNLEDCYIYQNWSNDIYMYDVTELNLTHCKLGPTCGAAVHMDDKPHNYADHHEYNCDMVINIDEYTSQHISNWVTGEEAWFVAYGFGGYLGPIKDGVNSAINPGNKTGLTISREIPGAPAGIEYVNFTFLCRARGTISNWSKDNVGYPSFLLNGDRLATSQQTVGSEAVAIAGNPDLANQIEPAIMAKLGQFGTFLYAIPQYCQDNSKTMDMLNDEDWDAIIEMSISSNVIKAHAMEFLQAITAYCQQNSIPMENLSQNDVTTVIEGLVDQEMQFALLQESEEDIFGFTGIGYLYDVEHNINFGYVIYHNSESGDSFIGGYLPMFNAGTQFDSEGYYIID